MSGSDRNENLAFAIIVAACVLILALPIAGLMLAEHAKVHSTNAAYQQNAERDRDATSKEISESCFNADFAIFSKCVAEKIATYYDQQATNQDLQAQQDMAYWAKTLFFLGIFQLVFSGFGIYFIWRSLALNRDAVNAAVEANSITRNVGSAQVRAYLDITAAEAAIVSDPKRNDGKHSPNFVINFNNSGNSPARKFSWYFLVIYLWPKEKLLRGEKTFPPDNWTKDIAANKPLSVNSHMLNGSLNDEEKAIFEAKGLHIIVTVVYRFIDVFDAPIIAEQNFAGHFANGTLGEFIQLHRWPSSAEEMHIMFNKSKVVESTNPDQPNSQ